MTRLDRAIRAPRILDDYAQDMQLLRQQLANAAERSNTELGLFYRLYADALGFEATPSYSNILSKGWDTDVREVDFRSAGRGARERINADAASADARLGVYLRPGSLAKTDRLVLASGLAFRGIWDEAFDPKLTRAQAFRLPSGTRKVPLMSRRGDGFDYAETASGRWLRVPYRRGDFHLVIGLPKKAGASPTPLLKEIPASGLKALAWRGRDVDFRLPRFRLDPPAHALGRSLRELGLAPLFRPGRADFSPLSAGEGLQLSELHQKVFLEFNEAGSAPPSAKRRKGKGLAFHVDQGFAVFVEHASSGLLMVAGLIRDPR